MRSKIFPLFLASAVLSIAAFTPLIAAAERATRINVPFDFVVKNKTCPAGNYTVQIALGNFVRLTSADGSKSFSWIAGPANVAHNDPNVILRFDDVDGIHTLRSVQDGLLVTSRLNKETSSLEHTHGMVVASR